MAIAVADAIVVWVDDDQLIINQWQGQATTPVYSDHMVRHSTHSGRSAPTLNAAANATAIASWAIKVQPVGTLKLSPQYSPSLGDTMNQHSKMPARCLLVLLGTILIAVGMTSVSLARTETPFHGPNEFIILKATSTRAHFTIDDSCEDIDENCTVTVRTSLGFVDPTNDGFENDWAGFLDHISSPCTTSGIGENGRNKDFEDCWKLLGEMINVTYTVEWPVIQSRRRL